MIGQINQIDYEFLSSQQTPDQQNFNSSQEQVSGPSVAVTTNISTYLDSQERDTEELQEENPPPLYSPEFSLFPMLGALHISLNIQENVMRMFHLLVKFIIYESIFPRSKFAGRPKPWRTKLLLALIYGGWTVIRSTVLSAFTN